MGKGRPRAVEKGVLGGGQSSSGVAPGSSNIPPAPVFYPTEEEFKDPLEYVSKIRPQAEPFGICRIVPPSSWKPPFALDVDSFTFPTKTQAIHQLQARPASCDSETFELEYNRFLEDHNGKTLKKKVVFEGDELDLCKLFNSAKRFGGYDKIVKEKKWGEVFRFVRPSSKISDCAKHVLCQLYREHLYDYETYYSTLNKEVSRNFKRGMHGEMKTEQGDGTSSAKRRRRNNNAEKVEVCKVENNEELDQRCEQGDGTSSAKRRRRNNSAEKVRVCKVENNEELDQICEQCRSGLHGDVMLLCDRCNRGWHIYCLSPPLKQIPPGNWYCFDCLNSNEDSFGFVPGKHFSLEAFRRMADRAKKKWFGPGPTSQMQLEKKFWEIVEGSVGEVEVLYGSDLDTSIYGSGFPHANGQKPESVEAKVWEEYCSSPWNLNNLPKLEGSVLRTVHQSIAGVMVPWLYVGMLFSSFCWHFEDHCFYSMNYLHWGDPKCWYSIPGSKAGAFEKVMKNSLPDLFDAQPDLLFQLVTMLNPSVLQENKVPVYNVLQEPGNFVVTFPRSYHGGFNFGLNCAEAVNFAPADWLPHGGFGAELYQLYHKAPVLSHEELLCVVAKKDCGNKVSPYLKKELLRVYTKEKTWRERLWKNGLVKSSLMPPRKCPEYVGTEEDPSCIICQQYLYLSAVVCHCRPSTFVCLEHWGHLCECKPHKRRLLYRHTLSELNDLVLSIDKYTIEEVPQIGKIQRQIPCSKETFALTKKVKGGHASLAQLAERWLLHSCKLFQSPFCSEDYSSALKKAEQFLWAGPEMDAVRETTKNLVKAKKWAEGIKQCLCKVENWLGHCSQDAEKLDFEYVDKLLSLSPEPCNVPGLPKLKDYAEEARALAQEINYKLSTSPKISELESLYSKTCCIPIHVKQSERLAQKINSIKAWIEGVNKCIYEKHPAAIEVDILYRLKSEALELQVELPETERLMVLLGQVESCQARCIDMLKGPLNLKAVEGLLKELQDFTVNFTELQLLRQHHIAAISWISRFNNVLVNIHQREDQENVVKELNCIMKDGASLRIHVDEFPLVDVELGKARCREKAHKARSSRMSLDFIKQLLMEAEVLQIGGEEIFSHMSGVVEIAISWEERATYILTNEAQMSDFEDVLRASENIFVILPSHHDVVDAISVANSWLKNSEPFLLPAISNREVPGSSLKVNDLKELVAQSKLLKISLKERPMLESVLMKCDAWRHDAHSVLQDVDCLFNMHNIRDGMSNEFISKIGFLSTNIKSIIEAGLSLGFDFDEIPKLRTASSMLQWCNKVLSFSSVAPSFEEIQSLSDIAESPPVSAGALYASLIEGVEWLKKAAQILVPSYSRGCKLSDAEEILAAYQCIEVSFPAMHVRLTQAIQKQKLWEEQVHQFFSLNSRDQSGCPLLKLKEIEQAAVFGCSELDMIISKVRKVEKWKERCEDIVEISSGDVNPLLSALLKINQSLTRSLHIYNKSSSSKVGKSSICCSTDTEDPKFLTCSTCNECYHLRCLGVTPSQTEHVETYSCSYCQWLEKGSIPQNGAGPLTFGRKRPELNMLIELLSEAEALPLWIEEKDILQQLVDQAIACKARLTEVLDFTIAYIDKDLSIVSDKLLTAIKAVEVAGVYYHQARSDLELALTRNSWRFRANKLLESKEKPTIHQIQRHLKEGLTMNIPMEDYFRQRLTELKRIGMQWADFAKKVATDSGALSLSEVFDLIMEGEKLPISLEKELKLLRARSMLYCICRKPYDRRAMIACDQCQEWYHFDCIKIVSTPKYYVCPACKPSTEVEASTPSLVDESMNTKTKELKALASIKMRVNSDESRMYEHRGGISQLWWRNRKPFRREAKKRAAMDSLYPFVHIQQQ